MVSDLLSSTEGSGGNSTTAPLKSYSALFEEYFPLYLSFGMTEEQYWDKDCCLVKAYRKAEELKTSRRNQEMWLQGAYIYDAICRISPILHAFAKKGTKPVPYLTEPYAVTKQQEKQTEQKKEKAAYNANKARMEGFMAQFNKRFEGK